MFKVLLKAKCELEWECEVPGGCRHRRVHTRLWVSPLSCPPHGAHREDQGGNPRKMSWKTLPGERCQQLLPKSYAINGSCYYCHTKLIGSESLISLFYFRLNWSMSSWRAGKVTSSPPYPQPWARDPQSKRFWTEEREWNWKIVQERAKRLRPSKRTKMSYFRFGEEDS